jgi:hypothetical protein
VFEGVVVSVFVNETDQFPEKRNDNFHA